MKKLITALMILAALLCLTGCAKEPDTSNPFEGYYVMSETIGGKPINVMTFIIKGNTIEEWVFRNPIKYTESSLNSLQLERWTAKTITVRDTYFEVEGDSAHYYLENTMGFTFLTSSNSHFGYYQKVDAGQTSSIFAEMYSIDYYLAANGDAIELYIYDDGEDTEYDFSIYVDEDYVDEDDDGWYYPDDIGKTGNTFTLTFDEDGDGVNEGSCKVTLSNTGATISDITNFPGTEPATTYTKYVRNTAWPVAQ